MHHEQQQGRKNDLLARRATLRERLERIRRDLQRPMDNDPEEQLPQAQDQQTLVETQRVLRQELARIEAQLDRLH